MRWLVFIAAVWLTACESRPAPVEHRNTDPTKESWYIQTTDRLAALNGEALKAFRQGNSDRAADLIKQAEPLSSRLLSVLQPTFEAMKAASDLDDLYGRMLFSNEHYGWARLQFQKNAARWKQWKPQTGETAALRKQAESAIAECDRKILE